MPVRKKSTVEDLVSKPVDEPETPKEAPEVKPVEEVKEEVHPEPQVEEQRETPREQRFERSFETETYPVKGILDIQPEGHGFLRPRFIPSQRDIYISQSQIRRFML